VPILTLFAAAWAARRLEPATAALHGLLVGLLVAGIFGVLYFAPFDLWGLLLFALMIAAGFAGGWRRPSLVKVVLDLEYYHLGHRGD
jgi:hypothetical protein